jgi:anti-anti-sigma factor
MNAITSPAMQEEINEALAGSEGRVVLDLSNVPFVSSQGLRVVIQTAKLARRIDHSAQLYVCGLQPQIHQIFALAGLDRVVDIRENLGAVGQSQNVTSTNP